MLGQDKFTTSRVLMIIVDNSNLAIETYPQSFRVKGPLNLQDWYQLCQLSVVVAIQKLSQIKRPKWEEVMSWLKKWVFRELESESSCQIRMLSISSIGLTKEEVRVYSARPQRKVKRVESIRFRRVFSN